MTGPMIAINSSEQAKILRVNSSNDLMVENQNRRTIVKKTYDWTDAVTAQAVWTPTSGTRFVLTNILISCSGACTVTLFDNTDDTTNRIFKASLAANSSTAIDFTSPVSSSAVNYVLKITTSATGGFLTVYGYEI